MHFSTNKHQTLSLINELRSCVGCQACSTVSTAANSSCIFAHIRNQTVPIMVLSSPSCQCRRFSALTTSIHIRFVTALAQWDSRYTAFRDEILHLSASSFNTTIFIASLPLAPSEFTQQSWFLLLVLLRPNNNHGSIEQMRSGAEARRRCEAAAKHATRHRNRS